jgi:phenylpyruvate tautomerase PptA (4-oxalocrotonate tautomerase family)
LGKRRLSMPVYQCFVQEGSITEAIRAEVASEITRLHVEATGAPRSFVNVLFFDVPRGHMFTAAAPSPTSIIGGTIRAGRTLEVRQQLLRDLSEMWTRVTGQPEQELIVGLTEVDASSVMEAGLIFPQPGQEAEWLEQNRDKLAALGGV